MAQTNHLPANGLESSTTERLVYVVDDDPGVRRSLHFALATSNITVWPFASAEDFLEQLETLKPAPVLLDLRMRNIDGMQVLQVLTERGYRWPTIMFTAYGEIPLAVGAMKLGALDFVEKPVDLGALEEILESCFKTLPTVVDHALQAEQAKTRLARLTQREEEVLQLLIKGSSNKSVAHDLDISIRTVEVHRSNALKKLSVKSLTQVVNLILLRNSQGSTKLA